MITFLNHHSQWIQEYAELINPEQSTVEQLANLLSMLLTNKEVMYGRYSLLSLIRAVEKM